MDGGVSECRKCQGLYESDVLSGGLCPTCNSAKTTRSVIWAAVVVGAVLLFALIADAIDPAQSSCSAYNTDACTDESPNIGLRDPNDR